MQPTPVQLHQVARGLCLPGHLPLDLIWACPAGGAQQDAVGVCAKEIEDPQLALFLCHMLEGPQGPLQHHLITTHMLPRASSQFVQVIAMYDA